MIWFKKTLEASHSVISQSQGQMMVLDWTFVTIYHSKTPQKNKRSIFDKQSAVENERGKLMPVHQSRSTL